MTTTDLSDVRVVRREEKQEKLSAFIARQISDLDDRDDLDGFEIKAVIRSPESPVARALAVTLHDLATEHAMCVQIIFVIESESGVFPDGLERADLRFAMPTRIADAHEQLVVGAQAVWIGDSMRRDPIKLDAFERFIENDPEPVRWAHMAFDRLWETSQTRSAKSGHGSLADFDGFDLAALGASIAVTAAKASSTSEG